MHACICCVQALRFQVGLAWAARVPTEFRLLNGLGPVVVGAAAAGDAAAMAAEGHEANRLMQVRSVLVRSQAVEITVLHVHDPTHHRRQVLDY
jgi:hypothetical protein